MRAFVAAGIGLVLSGCASVAANETGGVVEGVGSAKQALARADAHCAISGKTAKVGSYDAFMGSLTFECVAK